MKDETQGGIPGLVEAALSPTLGTCRLAACATDVLRGGKMEAARSRSWTEPLLHFDSPILSSA